MNKKYYNLDINNPSTFNEKISYIKFNHRNNLAPIVADKYAVREYVKNKIGDKYLVPMLAKIESIDEIDNLVINSDCIFKMNNGSGANLIVTKNKNVTHKEIKSFFKKAFSTDVYVLSREWHYRKIKPCIIVEELLGHNISDYKFLCNSNGPFAIQVDVDRFINHKRNLYDLEWNLLPYEFCYNNTEYELPKPKRLDEMIEVAKQLSKDFVFSRIDLYECDDKVWFGEITLHPEGGVGPFNSYESDLNMGKLVII